MKTQSWHNLDGWTLCLVVIPGKRANLTLFFEEQVMFHETFEWFQTERAQAKADALADLGHMDRVAKVGAKA